MEEDTIPKLEDWMTDKEVADWLGTTTRQLASNRIPSAKMGTKRFYKKTDVAAWLERRRDQR